MQACRKMGTPPASGSLDQIRRMQLAARGGGEWARTVKFVRTDRAANDKIFESIAGAAEFNSTSCCFRKVVCVCGCDTGPVFFFDTAQQVLFAQQLLLQASRLGAFDRMHAAAGRRSGVIDIASESVRKIAAVFRISS